MNIRGNQLAAQVRRRSAQALLIVGCWSAIALLWALHVYLYQLSMGAHESFLSVLGNSIADHWIWAALTPLVLLLARTFPFHRNNLATRIPIHVALCVLMSWTHVTAAHLLRIPPHASDTMFGDITVRFANTFYSDLWMYFPLVLVWNLIEYKRRYRERDREAAQLAGQLTQTQLQMLRNQLQPHFLFNTLNAVASLMHEDVDAADDMVVDLSCMLRYCLQEANEQEISLKHEMELLECYLRIQKHRFRHRLQTSIQAPTQLWQAKVPSLLLQPLVENAIEHGIAPLEREGRVAISVVEHSGSLLIRIEDNGIGFDSAGGERIGMGNSRARLHALYGDAQSLVVHSSPGMGTSISITLPLKLGGAYDAQNADRGRRTARTHPAALAAEQRS